MRPHKATLAICGGLLLAAIVAIGWALGEPTVSSFFAAWDAIELNPPAWVRPPHGSVLEMWLPVIVLVGTAQLIMMVSPRPQRWSRPLVVVLMLAAIGRYTLWRILASLNLAGPSDGIFSLILFGMEMAVIASAVLRLVLMFGIKSRSPQADKMAEAVLAGTYLPSVDVLIPTYNEPATILRRTVIGCQAMDYPNKQVYLLDDGKRPEIRQLAQQLGCHYIARPSNIHAKAGNINYALAKTGGELISIFDADFVPTTNFLLRTVGFFQERTVGLVQTQQGFYNPDPVARNLGLERVLPPEVEIFSRHYQPLRDTNETSICYGSSFVVRRRALED
ncbi:MAG: glycosyltransferase, partial [Cyanobacteria bacterium J06597_1]